MKHVHVQDGVKEVTWQCDHCKENFTPSRKAVPACCICSKDLCRKCKRHIHLEVGSGNGRPIPEQVNLTNNYCPDCFAPVVTPILDGLRLEVDRG